MALAIALQKQKKLHQFSNCLLYSFTDFHKRKTRQYIFFWFISEIFHRTWSYRSLGGKKSMHRLVASSSMCTGKKEIREERKIISPSFISCSSPSNSMQALLFRNLLHILNIKTFLRGLFSRASFMD